MEEGRVMACGEAIEGLCYEDAMRWCQRGWQAWRPNWPPGWFLFWRGGDVCTHTPDGAVAGTGVSEDRLAKDWIVRVFRHGDVMPTDQSETVIEFCPSPPRRSGTLTGTPTAPPDRPPVQRSFQVPWHHKDMEIRLQIAVHEIVARALAEGLSASGALRSVEHELARIAEQAEASENMAG